MPVKRCLHLNLDGSSAEELLLTKGIPGSFLVRPSCSKPGDFTVSVRRPNGTVTHVKIRNTGDCFSLYGEEKFASMVELIQHYMENGTLKEKSGDILLLKYPLPSTEPTTERWFHGYLSGPDAEGMLKSRGRAGSFLVRESRTQPGSHVLVVKADDEKVVQVIIRTLADPDSSGPLYDVGGGPKFSTLSELIEYYKQSAIIEENGSVLHLIQPFNATRIMANRVSDRIAELERSASKGESGFWEEFKYIQEQDQSTLTRKEGQRPENRSKNRYKNILPYDHSRVKLTEFATHPDDTSSSTEYDQSGSDYINANRIFDIDEPSIERREYIAAQGCMGSTVGDFWRMIWQEKCHIIIMITLEIERGKNKCVRYWPETTSSPNEIDSLSGKFTVTLASHNEMDHFGIRKFNVAFKSANPAMQAEEPRTVYQFYYKSWQDHSIPQDPMDIIELRDCVNEKWAQFTPSGPALVHCSAGIGRTGTYIVIDILLEQVRKYGVDSEIDVQRTVLSCRQQRSGLVQTESQYKFIYSVVAAHILRLKRSEYVNQLPNVANSAKKGEHTNQVPSNANSSSATNNNSTTTTNTKSSSSSSTTTSTSSANNNAFSSSLTSAATSTPNDYVNFSAANTGARLASNRPQAVPPGKSSSSSETRHDYANTQPGGIIEGSAAVAPSSDASSVNRSTMSQHQQPPLPGRGDDQLSRPVISINRQQQQHHNDADLPSEFL